MVIGKAQELTKFPLLSLKKKIYIEINDEIKNHAKERLKTLGRIIIKKEKGKNVKLYLSYFVWILKMCKVCFQIDLCNCKCQL